MSIESIISFENFKNALNKTIKSGDDFYIELLETVINNPNRYCGLFRLSNAKTKLIQNVTQSIEIKFGDFMEEIITEYISKMGYINITKDLGFDENGDRLNCDQLFTLGNNLYLVEQKIRDDHDSTKKRGQYANFYKKINLLKRKHPDKHIIGIMWFIDDGLCKNKNYYKGEMENTSFENVELHLYYGGEFFEELNNGNNVWKEIISHLEKLRLENTNEILSIPDFGTSDEIFNALLKLEVKYWKKLISNNEKYNRLRIELFSNGDNLDKAKKIRNK